MRDDLKKCLFWGLLTAAVFWAAGWRSKELFGTPEWRHDHSLEEMPVVSSAESLMIRYEFTGTDCKVRRTP